MWAHAMAPEGAATHAAWPPRGDVGGAHSAVTKTVDDARAPAPACCGRFEGDDGGCCAAPPCAPTALPRRQHVVVGGAYERLQHGHGPINQLPRELLAAVLGFVDHVTLLTAVPAVCRAWREACVDVRGVRLDLRFLPRTSRLWEEAKADELARVLSGLAARFPWAAELNLTDFCGVDDAAVLAVAERCTRLTSLSLSGCEELTDAGLTALATRNPLLRAVNVQRCPLITDAGVTALAGRCDQLTTIRVCYQTGAGMVALAERCPRLEEFEFCDCSGLDVALRAFAAHGRDIERVKIHGGHGVTAEGVAAFARGCRKLNRFAYADDFDGIFGDDCVRALAERCPQLVSVQFVGCTELTDDSLVALGACCPRLREAFFGPEPSDRFTDEGVAALATGCRELTAACFESGESLTDASAVSLAQHCPLLECIGLGFASGLTDSGVAALAMRCRNLGKFHFVGCERLTDASVTVVAKHARLPIRHVNFDGCFRLTPSSAAVLASCPQRPLRVKGVPGWQDADAATCVSAVPQACCC